MPSFGKNKAVIFSRSAAHFDPKGYTQSKQKYIADDGVMIKWGW